MATADQLYGTALTGLESLASTDPKAYEEALYQRVALDLQRRSELQERQIGEQMASRGLGLSSVANDLRARNTRELADALVRARLDASTNARQATQSALGQAAGVAQGEMQRRQQSDQFQAGLAQQKRGLAQQRDIASNQMLAQGLGGLTSAALYGAGRAMGGTPEMKRLGGRAAGAIDRWTGGGTPAALAVTGPAAAGSNVGMSPEAISEASGYAGPFGFDSLAPPPSYAPSSYEASGGGWDFGGWDDWGAGDWSTGLNSILASADPNYFGWSDPWDSYDRNAGIW